MEDAQAGVRAAWYHGQKQSNRTTRFWGALDGVLNTEVLWGTGGIEAFTATGWYRPVEAQRYRKSSWDAGDRLMGTKTLGNIGAGIFSWPGWRWSS